jgi:hypothetical protein
MDELLARYRRRDRAIKVAGAIILLVLIAILVLPDRSIERIEAPHPQVALFEPARSGVADERTEGSRAVRDRDRAYDFNPD